MVFAEPSHFINAARPMLQRVVGRDFKSMFGCPPEVCALTWNLLDISQIQGIKFKHLLWSLLFLKTYAKETILCTIAKVCRPTFRHWTRAVIRAIANLKPQVIILSNRFRNDRGRTCKMTVDGTDCPIREPTPFSRTWYSHKHKGAGLRYEVGVCIQTGDICWINGPFKCGTWSDIRIFRRDLKQRLRPGEMVECDGGYRGDASCRNKNWIVNPADDRAKSSARARHETVNGDIKSFQCLYDVWRHDVLLHRYSFAACAVLTQLSYNLGGGPRFQINY